jgi:hypothetical protein
MGQWSTHVKVRGIVPRGAWQEGDGSNAANNPLGAPGSTTFYLCLLHVRSSAGGDCYFPNTCGNLMENT